MASRKRSLVKITSRERSGGHDAFKPPTMTTAQPLTLLRLPRELRDHIYAFALDEPVRYARRHNAFCAEAGRKHTVPEEPPFAVDTPSCRCTRRRNLGLLLTSRQIYREAAPIFWRQTTFSFLSAAGVISGINFGAGKTYCRIIRHVRVDGDGQTVGAGTLCMMWHSLAYCGGLRTLEMEVELLRPLLIVIPDFLLRHPHLELLRYFRIERSRTVYDAQYRTWGNHLYWEVSQTIPRRLIPSTTNIGLDFSQPGMYWIFDRLDMQHFERLRYLVFLRQVCPKDYHRLKPGIDESHGNERILNLSPSGMEIAARVYGLPNCKATIAAHREERLGCKEKWKMARLAANQPTTPPAELAKAARMEIEAELQQKQRQFELVMKEKGIKVRKYRPPPNPEERWISKRRDKLRDRRRTLIRGAERWTKAELLGAIRSSKAQGCFAPNEQQ